MSRTSVHTMYAHLLVSMIEIALVHFAGLYSLITWLSRYLCYFVVSATHNLRNFVTSVTPLLCSLLIFSFCFFCFCYFATSVTLLLVTLDFLFALISCYLCFLVTRVAWLPQLPCYLCYLVTLLALLLCYFCYLFTCVTSVTLLLCYR